jgi:hypothetical protein
VLVLPLRREAHRRELGSPSEVSSRRPRSPMFEQGGSTGKAPVVDLSLSSHEEGLIPDTSRDEEFARRLFGDLNHDILGPSGDSNAIILSNSDEEEEVCKEDAVDAAAAPFSIAGIPTSTASAVDTDEDLNWMQDDNSDDLAPDHEIECETKWTITWFDYDESLTWRGLNSNPG